MKSLYCVTAWNSEELAIEPAVVIVPTLTHGIVEWIWAMLRCNKVTKPLTWLGLLERYASTSLPSKMYLIPVELESAAIAESIARNRLCSPESEKGVLCKSDGIVRTFVLIIFKTKTVVPNGIIFVRATGLSIESVRSYVPGDVSICDQLSE